MIDSILPKALCEWSYIKLSEIPSRLYKGAELIDPESISWVDNGHNVATDPIYASYEPGMGIVYVIDGRRRLATIAAEGDAETLVHVYQTPYIGAEKVRRVNLNDKGRSEIRAIVFTLVRQFGCTKTAAMLKVSEAEVSDMADGHIREVGTAHAFS